MLLHQIPEHSFQPIKIVANNPLGKLLDILRALQLHLISQPHKLQEFPLRTRGNGIIGHKMAGNGERLVLLGVFLDQLQVFYVQRRV